jgi:hypothetical protein
MSIKITDSKHPTGMKKYNAYILLMIILASLIFLPFSIFPSSYNVKAFGLTSYRTTITPTINPTLSSANLHPVVSSPKISPTTHTITLNPTSGYVRTVVKITGSGFTPPLTAMVMKSSYQVLIMYAGKQISSINTNSNGTFTTTFTVPPSVGVNNVTATYGASSASAPFTVMSQQFGLTTRIPTLTLSPNTGTVGNSTKVTGTNFSQSSAILITYAGNVITNTTSNTDGFFSATFVIPTSIGTNNVTATDASHHSASAPFTVITPSSTQTMQKNSSSPTQTTSQNNSSTTQITPQTIPSQPSPPFTPNFTMQSTPSPVSQPPTTPSPATPQSPQVTVPTQTPPSNSTAPSQSTTLVPTASNTSSTQTTPSISIQTDKYSYLPKDNIYVSGIVTGLPSGDFVQLQFYDSNGILKNLTLVTPNSIDGRFFVSYVIPDDMTSGTGKVVASLADSKLTSQSAGLSATNSAFYVVSSDSNPWMPIIAALGVVGVICGTIFFKFYHSHNNDNMRKHVTGSQPKSGNVKDETFFKVPNIEIEIRAGIENE